MAECTRVEGSLGQKDSWEGSQALGRYVEEICPELVNVDVLADQDRSGDGWVKMSIGDTAKDNSGCKQGEHNGCWVSGHQHSVEEQGGSNEFV